jgi:hypothetical protein
MAEPPHKRARIISLQDDAEDTAGQQPAGPSQPGTNVSLM